MITIDYSQGVGNNPYNAAFIRFVIYHKITTKQTLDELVVHIQHYMGEYRGVIDPSKCTITFENDEDLVFFKLKFL